MAALDLREEPVGSHTDRTSATRQRESNTIGTTRAFRNVRYLIAIGGAKRTLVGLFSLRPVELI